MPGFIGMVSQDHGTSHIMSAAWIGTKGGIVKNKWLHGGIEARAAMQSICADGYSPIKGSACRYLP